MVVDPVDEMLLLTGTMDVILVMDAQYQLTAQMSMDALSVFVMIIGH